jgi:hypothetical protein
MANSTDTFIKGKQAERRRQDEAERQLRDRLPKVHRIAAALSDFRKPFQDFYNLRQNADATREERAQMHGKVADAFLRLSRQLTSEGEEHRLDRDASLQGPLWSLAQDLFQLGRQEERDALLSRLDDIGGMPAEDQSDVWRHVLWFTDSILGPVEAMTGSPPVGTDALQSSNTDNGAEMQAAAASPEQPAAVLDPAVQAIIDEARAKERQALAAQRTLEESAARWRRASEAWLRVRDFQGEAIPPGLTGRALHRRYAELIVELGRVLKVDGWSDRIDAVRADTDPKKYALTLLRKAMEGDISTVTTMIYEGVNTLFHLGLQADSWLRTGLMNEVLGIQQAPEPPLGWEGSYDEEVETAEDFIRWIDREFLIHETIKRGQSNRPSDGRLIRNAYRLVTKLELAGMPLEPIRPFTLNAELAVLRNLRRLCLERKVYGSPQIESDPTASAGPEGVSECKDRPATAQIDGDRTEAADPPKGRTITPLSRLDLPRIVEAIRILYCIIEHPPAKPWQPPPWLVEQFRQTTAGEEGLQLIAKNPTHCWVIDGAGTEVLNRLMPPWHHSRDDCPEITESQLDLALKVKLLELRKMLLRFGFSETVASNRAEALQVFAFLESVLVLLGGKPAGGTGKSEGAGTDRDQDGAEQDEEAGHKLLGRKPKRSTTSGSARAKIIGYLIKHHKYADGAVLNKEPIQCNELAIKAKVAKASASRFFEKEFGGYEKYAALCRRNSAELETSLKVLNGDFSPHLLYGRTPPGESQSDEE